MDERLEQQTPAQPLTASHDLMCTAHDMAPKQIERSRTVAHCANRYSLGAVINKMLIGGLPLGRFEAPSHESKVDRDINDVVPKALAKDPERRHQHSTTSEPGNGRERLARPRAVFPDGDRYPDTHWHGECAFDRPRCPPWPGHPEATSAPSGRPRFARSSHSCPCSAVTLRRQFTGLLCLKCRSSPSDPRSASGRWLLSRSRQKQGHGNMPPCARSRIYGPKIDVSAGRPEHGSVDGISMASSSPAFAGLAAASQRIPPPVAGSDLQPTRRSGLPHRHHPCGAERALDSALVVGIVLMVSFLPRILLGPFAGTIADRWPRKPLLILSDLMAGVLVLTSAAAIAAAPPTGWPWIIAVIAVLRAIVTLPFGPALGAALPDLLPPSLLPRAHALLTASSQGASLVGQAAGGALAQLLGLPMLLTIDAVSFLVAGTATTALHLPAQPRPARRPLRDSVKRYARDHWIGLRFVWRHRGLRHQLVANAFLGLTGICFFVLLPFLAGRVLGDGKTAFGLLLAFMGGGSLLGSLFAGLPSTPAERKRAVIASLLACNIPYCGMGLVSYAWQAAACVAATGFLCALGGPSFESIVALRTPGRLRGRVLAARDAISAAGMPVGMLLSGWCGDHFEVRKVYLVAGMASILVAIA